MRSTDRFDRNLDDLRALVQTPLTRKGVRVEFVKVNLVSTGEDIYDQPHAVRQGRLPNSNAALSGNSSVKATPLPSRAPCTKDGRRPHTEWAAELVKRRQRHPCIGPRLRHQQGDAYQYLCHAQLEERFPAARSSKLQSGLCQLYRIFIVGVWSGSSLDESN